MTEKRISSYVIHKHDFDVNWRQSDLIPAAGQIIVYDKETDENGALITTLPEEGRTAPYTHERIKVGDGKTNVNDLPFADSLDEIYVGEGDMPEGASIQIILDAEDVEEEYKNEIKDYIDSELSEIAALDEVYVGEGDMPSNATLQIILDAADEEEALENELKNYIDSELTRAKNSGEFKGDSGNPGAKGDPGYTPVKGVDYWTAADQQAMVEAVLNALPIGEEAVF